MKPNFTTITQVLNQEINIYTYQLEHSPEQLPNNGYLVTTTEYDEPTEAGLMGHYTMRIIDLPNIYKEYLDAFEEFIDNSLTLFEGFGDDEYYDYLPDYIEQLLQMGAILHNGLNDTPEDILAIINEAAKKHDYDFSELLDCFDWEHISKVELDWNLILNHIDL